MKIFQIFAFPGTTDYLCHWDATGKFPTLASASGKFAPDVVFVEAPDYVFEGWGYDPAAGGDARFIQPPLPTPSSWISESGVEYHWVYDAATGTFYVADASGAAVAGELA